MKGRISEIFESLQGEGIYLGEKQIFVRFFGCNINCRYCDTKLLSYEEYEPADIFAQIEKYDSNFHSISFTGGEPLLQKDFLKELLKLTSKAGYKNYLETNGTLPEALEDVIEYIHIVAMDLKFPSSTGSGEFWQQHHRFLEISSQRTVFLKAVICNSTTDDDLNRAISLIRRVYKNVIFVLQPNSFEMGKALTDKLVRYKDICIKGDLRCRIIPQMHKIVGLK